MNRHVRFYASLGWANDIREQVVDMVEAGYDDWDDMTVADQEKACEEFFNDAFLPNYLDSGWHEVAQ